MPLAKIQDEASIKSGLLSRFSRDTEDYGVDQHREYQSLLARKNFGAPINPKNWLGRRASGEESVKTDGLHCCERVNNSMTGVLALTVYKERHVLSSPSGHVAKRAIRPPGSAKPTIFI